ncbi:von Willebrand factor type A domain-containing protein [Natranaerovirga hydrolytica]|uniref:von Willebrand factor type A domain-containing protein n=1 Tax=Natranaerovirga hydrolytica TaxID=680378 RepID=A0A4R1MZS4_9FIRM|nr:BatA and WFA domain-containing protein [Natranaerovirga hydrolytica]TCK98695.1 von Willebrand factor type A domain-containing protein [Natranaerovirga hydrolytica]
MGFIQLWPLVFLILIPLVIIMYLLKQKSEDFLYSSTFLWEEVYKNMEVNTPWEKLKKSLLFFLQLFLILFFIFLLMNPFIESNNNDTENLLLVIDNSGSMNGYYNEKTRFENAIEGAIHYLDTLSQETSISIITIGNAPTIELSNTRDKELAKDTLKGIEPTHMSANMEESLSLITSITDYWTEYQVLFFTDQDIHIENINGQIVPFDNELSNVSMDYVSHSHIEGRLHIMAQVTNRSSVNQSIEVNLYGDGNLLNIERVSLEPEETKIIQFNDVTFDGHIIQAEINESDDLIEDNIAYDVLSSTNVSRVLLGTNRNIFLERALLTVPNIELYKTSDIEDISRIEDYDLYIIDGLAFEQLPRGNVFLINPNTNPFVEVNQTFEGGVLRAQDTLLTSNIEMLNFAVRELKNIQGTHYMDTFLQLGDEKVGLYGESDGQKIVVIPFDFHDSDLVLKPEFPILMHNIMEYLLDSNILKSHTFTAGEAVSFHAHTRGSSITITKPNGENEEVPIRFPMLDFTNTKEAGIYTATQTIEEETLTEYFVVNFPQEEKIRGEPVIMDNNQQTQQSIRYGRMDLTKYLIMALLGLVLVEWIAYILDSRR